MNSVRLQSLKAVPPPGQETDLADREDARPAIHRRREPFERWFTAPLAGDPHLDVWRQYWRRVGRSGRTGIWHETYLVRSGQYEALYGNMPAHGLGKAGQLVPVSESSSARGRLGALEERLPV